ncbi:hypothetical protein [Natronorubrum tibetense]|uniref:hypothetical protein n=1 Tax=Natronorubrum tibetense TaxID=63128 RepID=UPI00187D730D|nr:hypothetical protein [Natronorubrum tibetense]
MATLNGLLDEANPSDTETVRNVLSTYDQTIETAALTSATPPTVRERTWRYYRPIVELLDETVQIEGWDFLADVLESYNPDDQFGVPPCSHVLVNVVGRFVIRTRLRDGIDTVPAVAVRYLRAFSSIEDHTLARKESQTYGWAIGHPDHATAEYLRSSIEDKHWWTQAALEHAFYADQRAAADLLTSLVVDESLDFSAQLAPECAVSKERFLFECLVGPDTDDYHPNVPRFWSQWNEITEGFEWSRSVELDLRSLVRRTGVEDELPEDWTFQDLSFRSSPASQ